MIDAINNALTRAGFGHLRLNPGHLVQLSWMGWGQAAGLFLSLLSIKLTTSAGPSEYGLFILVTSLGGLLSLSLFSPLEQAVVRYLFEFSAAPDQRSAYLRMVGSTLLKAFWLLALLAVIVSVFGVQFAGYSWRFMAAGSMLVTVTVLSVPMNGLLNALKERKQLALIQVAEKALIVLFLQVAVWYTLLDATMIMECIVAAMLLMFAARIRVFRRQIGTEGDSNGAQQLRRSAFAKVTAYGLPFVLWGWLSWAQLNGERWVINSTLSTDDVGRYGLAAGIITNTVVMLYTVLIQFITPSVYAKFSGGRPEDRTGGFQLISVMTWATFILFSVFGLFLFAVGEHVIRLLSTRAFIVDESLLLLLTVAVGVFYMGQTLSMVGMAMEQPNVYLYPKIIAAVFSVGATITGGLHYGLAGVLTGILCGNLVYLFGIIMVNKRNFAVHRV